MAANDPPVARKPLSCNDVVFDVRPSADQYRGAVSGTMAHGPPGMKYAKGKRPDNDAYAYIYICVYL